MSWRELGRGDVDLGRSRPMEWAGARDTRRRGDSLELSRWRLKAYDLSGFRESELRNSGMFRDLGDLLVCDLCFVILDLRTASSSPG